MKFNPRRWNVSTKIGWALVLVALFPILLLAQLGSMRLRDQSAADGERDLKSIAAAVTIGLDTEIAANLEIAGSVANDSLTIAFTANPNERGALQNAIDERLDTLKAAHTTTGSFFILDAEGTAIAASDRAQLGKNYSFRRYFKRAMLGTPNVSDIYIPLTAPIPGTAFAYPIRYQNVVIGVAAIRSYALSVSKSLVTANGRAALIVEDTGLISSDTRDIYRLSTIAPFTPEAQKEATDTQRFTEKVPTLKTSASVLKLLKTAKPGFSIGSINGNKVAVAWRPLRQVSWRAVVIEPIAVFDKSANQARELAIKVALLVSFASIFLAIIVARALSRPLRELTIAASALEEGTPVNDSSLNKIASRGDDLGALAARLADAARETALRESRLQAQVRRMTIEINAERRKEEVTELTESDFFSDIQSRGAQMRRQRIEDDNPPAAGI